MRLTEDQEADLRDFFCGHLAQAGGVRSTFGAALERARLRMAAPTASEGSCDNHAAILSAMARHDRVQACLMRLCRTANSRLPAQVLSIVYSSIRAESVLGLVGVFGTREVAAVAVQLVQVEAPGESQSQVLIDLRDSARAAEKRRRAAKQDEPTSWEREIEDRRVAAKVAIRRAKDGYAVALREQIAVERADRTAQRQARSDALADRWAERDKPKDPAFAERARQWLADRGIEVT
jgi:hypothetical protein